MLIWIWLKFVPKIYNDNDAPLVQRMAPCRTGDLPLSESIAGHFIDAYMRDTAAVSQCELTVIRTNHGNQTNVERKLV